MTMRRMGKVPKLTMLDDEGSEEGDESEESNDSDDDNEEEEDEVAPRRSLRIRSRMETMENDMDGGSDEDDNNNDDVESGEEGDEEDAEKEINQDDEGNGEQSWQESIEAFRALEGPSLERIAFEYRRPSKKGATTAWRTPRPLRLSCTICTMHVAMCMLVKSRGLGRFWKHAAGVYRPSHGKDH